MSALPKISIIGSGLVGRGGAIVFARGGYDVALYDGQSDVAALAKGGLAQSPNDLCAHGLLDDPASVLDRMAIAPDLASALEGAAYAQESVSSRSRGNGMCCYRRMRSARAASGGTSG